MSNVHHLRAGLMTFGLALAVPALVALVGCPPSTPADDNSNTAANANENLNRTANTDSPPAAASLSDRCALCHSNTVRKYTEGTHKGLSDECASCHANAVEHASDPTVVHAHIDFSLSACASCHADQYATYLHDDGSKPGHYGGSVATSKYLEYPHYQYLMGGHGFTREYNEEGAHAYMLKDHIETARRQTTTCLQCKSTPVAYYWNKRSRGAVQFEKTQEWSTVVQRIRDEYPETIDYGAGCTHCHDPHNGDFRLIRRGVIEAILERGTDPYSSRLNVVPADETELAAIMNARGTDGKRTAEAMRLAGTLTCAQCHIEYVCGKGADSATTGEIRDHVPWRKLADIEGHYQAMFNNQQDWKHSVTGVNGIKPQHPETESYWGSPHHMLGMSCADCHMARSYDAAGNRTASHWLTSPLKNNTETCANCHDNVQSDLFATQDAFYAKAIRVQDTLNALLLKIADPVASSSIPAANLATAKSLYMRALTWWEWTAVSENSMGAHNGDEMNAQFDTAEELAQQALDLFP